MKIEPPDTSGLPAHQSCVTRQSPRHEHLRWSKWPVFELARTLFPEVDSRRIPTFLHVEDGNNLQTQHHAHLAATRM